jgi:hypothetical protein
MERHDDAIDPDLAQAFRRLNAAAVPPVDPAREAALLAAFDAEYGVSRPKRRDYWYLSAFAAAAAVLIAVGISPALTGRHGPLPDGPAHVSPAPSPTRGVQSDPPSEFVIVPEASALPPMESGTLVRVHLPAAELSSYGVTPPPGQTSVVTADLIVGQDGLTRAVRIVN